jgi:ribonuclease P protein component
LIERSPLPLRGSVQFQDVFSNADSRQHSKDVLVLVKKNFCNQHRVGLITSKKKLRRAVDRNRFRRIARASLLTLATDTGFDVIFMAKAPITDLHQSTCSHRLGQQLLKAVSKATPKTQ